MGATFLALYADPGFYTGAPASGAAASAYEYFCNVHTWFNQQSANALLELKNAKDAFGGSLLDFTIVPFITDSPNGSDMPTPLPALLVGGKKLGMQGVH